MAENLGANFTIDITSLKAGLKTANALIRESESEFKAAAAGMGDWTKSEAGLEAKLKSLTDIEGIQQKKVDALKAEYERLVKDGLDPTSSKAISLRTQINKEGAALATTRLEIGKQTSALDELRSGTEKAEGATRDAEQATKDYDSVLADGAKTGGGLDALTVAMGTFVEKAAEKVIAAFKDIAQYAADAYGEFDKGADAVVKATGATGAVAEELQASYAKVARNVKGDSETIGKTLGEVSTRFGLTGEELEEVTEQFLKFADVTDADAVKSVRLVSRAMQDAGIDSSEYADVLDQLAVAAQVSGVDIETLMDSLDTNGPTMKNLGYSTQEMIAMFAQWEKAGVNSETATRGLKQAVAGWAKEGKNAREEYRSVLALIQATPDETEAAKIAVETFGTKAGPELVEAITSGRLAFDNMLQVVAESQGTVNATYDQTLDTIDKVEIKIQGLRIRVGELLDRLLTVYGPKIEEWLDKIDQKLGNISDEDIEGIINGINKTASALRVLGRGMTVTGVGFNTIKQGGSNAFGEIWKKVKDFYIYTTSEAVPDMIASWASGWDNIKQKAGDIWGWLEQHGSDWIDNFFTGWRDIFNWFEQRLRDIQDLVESIFNKASSFGGIGDLTGGIKSALASIGIPKLAAGGVVRRATNAIIGEDGAEAVVPLERNTEWLDKLAAMITDRTGGGVTYNFNQTNNSPKALSRWEIYRQTRNLINAARGV